MKARLMFLISLVLTIVALLAVIGARGELEQGVRVGFTLVVESIDDHRLARDTLLPDWTCTEVKAVRVIYLATLFSLWFAIAAAPRWLAKLR